jgi:Tol biopolymer transport system component
VLNFLGRPVKPIFLTPPLRLPRAVAGLAACALVALCTLSAPAGAAFKGRNGELAYEGRASAAGALLVRSPSGGDVRRLAAPGKPADPAFSPLGRRIAFTSRSEIWVMYADGTNIRQVTVGPEPSRNPTWSPAADALAFTTGYAGDRDLYAIGADGYGLRRVTGGRADDEAPAWSSRQQIAFVRHAAAGRDGDLFTVPAGGGTPRALTGGPEDDRTPAWAPDGRRLVFTRLPPARPPTKQERRRHRRAPARLRELWVVHADGAHAHRVATLPADVSSPAWSPDGRRIAFAMGRNGTRGIYAVRSNGRGLQRLAAGTADARSLDWQPEGGNPVIAAAGDMACDPASARFAVGLGTGGLCHMLQTSDLLMKLDLSAILTLGDEQYETGTYDAFLGSFDPTWGRLKSLIRPVVGNHEYHTPGASGYFDYFDGIGAADGPAGPRDAGYYSYDIGTWHVVALNSQCSDRSPGGNPYANDCAAGSPQERWLRADLAAHPAHCTLALWHHPLLSSGVKTLNAAVQPLFQALYDNGVDVLLTGHDHGYERFAPMDPAVNRDGTRGVREFVVGTGGKSHQHTTVRQPQSEIREDNAYGILALTLGPDAYKWQFRPEAGASFTDAGANACH